jgi:hypothetical protein
MTVKTDDQDFCEKLLKWFSTLFEFGIFITDEFLKSYSLLFERRTERVKQDKSELNNIFPPDNSKINLNNIDFKNQFFKKEHFAAFEGIKPWNMTDEVNQERMKVRNRFFKLHTKLYPQIQDKGWDLHEHYIPDDIVSSAIHGQFTSDELNAIWIHYGRNKDDIKTFGENETPLDFMRLQVIIHKDNMGIWNRIGKDFGSRVDRDYFKHKITTDSNYKQNFFSVVKQLPDNFFIKVNQKTNHVAEFKTEKELTDFVLKDELKYYFIIGIEFPPNDIKLCENDIVDTIIENFGHLYPIYELMKYNMKL